MASFLYNMLLMSMSGTMMFLLATLLYKQTKRKYARWYYALVITSVLLLILPLQRIFSIPNAITVEVPQSISIPANAGTDANTGGFDFSYLIFGIWAAGAVALLLFNAYSYIRTRRTLFSISAVTEDERAIYACEQAIKLLNLKADIRIRKSDTLRSPLLFGIIRPTVILPDVHFSDSELRMIFTHELTHYRHKDLVIKLLAIFASSLHWFNPCVYVIKKAVNNGCELCCDETVLSVLNLSDKKQYGRLLISIIEDDKGGFAYTTAMSSQQSIKQRLLKIVEFKRMSLPIKMVCVMAALSITVCSVTVFGFDIAKETLPEEISKAIDIRPTPRPRATEAPAVTDEPVITEQPRQSYSSDAYSEQPVYDYSEYDAVPEPETVADTTEETTETNTTEIINDQIGELESVSADGSKETYSLSDGSTAIVHYDGDEIDKGYILVD